MGSYLNPGSSIFKMELNSQIYIDKSRLIEATNKSMNTMQRFVCVSRPRRFGKSMAADMLASYYGYRQKKVTFLPTAAHFAPFQETLY